MFRAAFVLGLLAASPSQAGFETLFDATSHDFGAVPHGSVQIHRFTLKNTTDSTIHISSFRSSCKCATPLVPEPTAAPGESIYVEVQYNTQTFTGARSMVITVTFDKPRFETVQLRVSGVSRQDVVFNPSQISLGVLSKGQPATGQLKVEYAGPIQWQITGVASDDGLAVAFEETYREPRRVGYVVKATLPEDLAAGPLFKNIQLKTNDPGMPLLTIPVTGTIESILTAAPDRLQLGQMTMGDVLKKRIILKGKSPFTLEKVTGDVDGVLVRSTEGERTSHIVEIEFSPTKTGKIEQEILFTTTLDKDQPLPVHLSAQVAPKAE